MNREFTAGLAPRRRERRLSFRTRLTLTITGVFVAAGATLMVVQYAVVQQLFSGAIEVTMSLCSVGGETWSKEVSDAPPGDIIYDANQVTGCQFVTDDPQ